MYVDDDRLIVSASDLTGFLECAHLTGLDRRAALGELPPPERVDGTLDVVARKGLEHEARQVRSLREAGLTVVEVPDPQPGGLAAAQQATVEAMRSGADVIYQATFFDGRWRGHADFLEKRPDRSSDLGSWSYDVADTKLARRLKVPALLQMAVYAHQLEILQGAPPEWLTVITGDSRREPFRYRDVAAYARRARRRFLDVLDAHPRATYPVPVSHCAVCRWKADCEGRWRSDDHLSLVAYMRRDHREALEAAGIGTVHVLGATPGDRLPPAIGAPSRHRLAGQARLQLEERRQGGPVYELSAHATGRGFDRLPAPSHGDLFFDIEGDPFAGDQGLEYLWGVADRKGEFTAYWAHDSAEEERAVERVIDHIMDAWAADPGMHVYHYAPYETARLRALTARYGTRTDELDRMLRTGRFVDLYAVVRQGMRISKESYSLKKLEDFYRPAGRGGAEIAEAGDSIVAYERWLSTGDSAELDAIEHYNGDDCLSTSELRDWLEQRRGELLARGDRVLRPEEGTSEPPPEQVRADARTEALAGELLAAVPDDPGERSPEHHGRWLLAQLLGWHRREARAEWWDFYRLRDLEPEDLEQESAALGPLSSPEFMGVEARSGLWRYGFPPQDCKAGLDDRLDHLDVAGSSKIAAIDPEAGWVELKRELPRAEPQPRGLVPQGPRSDIPLREALHDLGAWVRDHGIDGPGRYRAGRDLLLGHPPRLRPGAVLRQPGEAGGDALRRTVLELDGGVLPVQGPPGSGKTYAGARAIVDLVRAGRRVGITALSHKAIGNLLDEVMRAARQQDVSVRAVQRASENQRCGCPEVERADRKEEVATAVEAGTVDVVAGTAWLFADPRLDERLDVLVVDEAGQLSLANTLVVARAATSLALLGDPQQLAQPSKDVHPPGAGVSALEHVLAGHDTLPAERGLFFETTYRMSPEVCAVVSEMSYEGRLAPGGDALLRDFRPPAELAAPGGRGVRWWPVAHSGNASASTEEAEVVRQLVVSLRDVPWCDPDGGEHAVTLDDILVVAPYNAQVGRIRSRLGSDARVGTVDKFQGQEAPIVIVSLAASSAEDAPRGVNFLLDRNRLNVALSRARLMSIVVGSPQLLVAPVRTPEQLRLVNGLCRLVEQTPGIA